MVSVKNERKFNKFKKNNRVIDINLQSDNTKMLINIPNCEVCRYNTTSA